MAFSWNTDISGTINTTVAENFLNEVYTKINSLQSSSGLSSSGGYISPSYTGMGAGDSIVGRQVLSIRRSIDFLNTAKNSSVNSPYNTSVLSSHYSSNNSSNRTAVYSTNKASCYGHYSTYCSGHYSHCGSNDSSYDGDNSYS